MRAPLDESTTRPFSIWVMREENFSSAMTLSSRSLRFVREMCRVSMLGGGGLGGGLPDASGTWVFI